MHHPDIETGKLCATVAQTDPSAGHHQSLFYGSAGNESIIFHIIRYFICHVSRHYVLLAQIWQQQKPQQQRTQQQPTTKKHTTVDYV